MAKKDYYEILGVPKTATQDEIKKAYRQLALKHHPDKNQGSSQSEEIFKEITEAFSIIGDKEKRANYDRGGFDFQQYNPTNDMFESFYRSHVNWRPTIKGSDLRLKLQLNIYEIFNGANKKVKFKREVVCSSCKGTGAANAHDIQVCPICNGIGISQKMKKTNVGIVIVQEQCSNCNGTGKEIKVFCPICKGNKIDIKEEVIDLAIPRGVKNGDVLSFSGAGNAPRGEGINGNLLVVIEEESDAEFTRQNSDLFIKHEISIFEAIFGKSLEVKTIDGLDIKTAITPGIQSGTHLKIEGKGLYQMGSNHRGDMYINVVVYIPNALTDKDKELLEELKNSESFKPIKK